MPMLNLIEPDRRASFGVFDRRRRDTTDSEAILPLPLKLDPCISAVLFYFAPLVRFEEVLPAHVEVVGKVSDIHDSALFEPLSNLSVDSFIHFAAVHDRSFASGLCSLDTMEPLLQWPLVHVGTFVVKQDSFF